MISPYSVAIGRRTKCQNNLICVLFLFICSLFFTCLTVNTIPQMIHIVFVFLVRTWVLQEEAMVSSATTASRGDPPRTLRWRWMNVSFCVYIRHYYGDNYCLNVLNCNLGKLMSTFWRWRHIFKLFKEYVAMLCTFFHCHHILWEKHTSTIC